MPFDGLSVYATVKEIKQAIIHSKIHKIYQPVRDEILLYFSDRDKTTLLISADPSFPRMHMINQKSDNPTSPPSFCMLLRKYLLGAIVKDIQQKDFDRIVSLRLETLNDAGVLQNLTLIIEIMGRHSNIILVDDETNKILDSIKHITRMKSSVREVMPGKNYQDPPNEKVSPLCGDVHRATEQLMFYRDKSAANALVSVYNGLSPQLASSLIIQMNLEPQNALSDYTDNQIIGIAESVYDFFLTVDLPRESYIYKEPSGKYKDFSYGYYPANDRYLHDSYTSFNTACEEFYAKKSISNRIQEKYESIIKNLETLIAKEENKLLIRTYELERAEDHDKYQIMGNLLLSNLNLITKGMREIRVQNYYDEQLCDLIIPLREDYSPSDNAQMYFKKYNKAKSAILHLTGLIEQSKETIYYLQSQHYYLTHAQNASEAEEVLADLEERQIFKHKKGGRAKTKQRQTLSQPYRYVTQDLFEIYVGKNDKQNERLTLKSASKDDIWLHTKEIPGSHVILKTNHGTYTDESLVDAAKLAAYYSKAQHSENVPVDYAYVKYVKKPKGSPTGKVIYTDYKTIYVTPSELQIQELEKSE